MDDARRVLSPRRDYTRRDEVCRRCGRQLFLHEGLVCARCIAQVVERLKRSRTDGC